MEKIREVEQDAYQVVDLNETKVAAPHFASLGKWTKNYMIFADCIVRGGLTPRCHKFRLHELMV